MSDLPLSFARPMPLRRSPTSLGLSGRQLWALRLVCPRGGRARWASALLAYRHWNAARPVPICGHVQLTSTTTVILYPAEPLCLGVVDSLGRPPRRQFEKRHADNRLMMPRQPASGVAWRQCPRMLHNTPAARGPQVPPKVDGWVWS